MAIKISGVNIVDDSQNLRITGVSTFTNGPILVGSATSTGTASQPLQVSGGAYVSGNLGIGTTEPTFSSYGTRFPSGLLPTTGGQISDSNLKLSVLDGNVTILGNTGNQNRTFNVGPYVSVIGIGSTNTLTGDTYPCFNTTNYSNTDFSSGEVGFYKAGLTSAGIATTCSTNFDTIGTILARAYTGTLFENAARLEFRLNSRNITGSGNHPSADLLFFGRTSGITTQFGGKEHFRIKGDTGNVGVGTAVPESLLHLRSAATSAPVNFIFLNNPTSASANVGARIVLSNNGNPISDQRHSYIGALISGSGENGNHLVFATNPNGNVPVERMRITSTGDVGIGIINPTEKLHVVGNILSSGSVTATTFSGALNGNAATATSAATLTTARTINGVSFNGSANINVPDLRDPNGAILIDGTGVTSAVNYVTLTNAATTGSPTLSTAGSDTNVNLNISTKGTGSVSLNTAGGAILLRPGASGVRIYDDSNVYYHNIATGTMTANRTLTLPNASVTLVSGTMVPTTTSVTAGNGLSGGGALSGNVTLTLGTPGTLTSTSTNAVSSTSHTHSINVGDVLISPGTGVGSYHLLRLVSGTENIGDSEVGSNLRRAKINSSGALVGTSAEPPGTYRLQSAGITNDEFGLWQRIA